MRFAGRPDRIGTPAQISDFGLAKLLQQDQDLHTTTRVLGTFGYFDPEYALVRIRSINQEWSFFFPSH